MRSQEISKNGKKIKNLTFPSHNWVSTFRESESQKVSKNGKKIKKN